MHSCPRLLQRCSSSAKLRSACIALSLGEGPSSNVYRFAVVDSGCGDASADAFGDPVRLVMRGITSGAAAAIFDTPFRLVI